MEEVAIMKAFRISVVLGVLLTNSIAFGMHTKTDYDRSFDFHKLRTFTFKDQYRSEGRVLKENTIVDRRIKDALIKDLEAKGFRYAPEGNADFQIAYYAHEREKAEIEGSGYLMPRSWRRGWGPDLWTHYYTEGSVVVDFIDANNNQLFWRGRVTDTVKGLDQSAKQIEKGANKLVKDFVKDEQKHS